MEIAFIIAILMVGVTTGWMLRGISALPRDVGYVVFLAGVAAIAFLVLALLNPVAYGIMR